MDVNSFHKLALSELDALYRFAYYLSRDAQEAEELVQETYLRALKKKETFLPGAHGIRPWLFKILHNLLNTRLSRDRRDSRQLESYGAELAAHTPPQIEVSDTISGDIGPSDVWPRIDWDKVDGRLKSAVLELPLDKRTVFLCAALEGMTYREIATLTDVPVGTVMSRLARARRTLAEKLSGLAAEQNLRPHSGTASGGSPDPASRADGKEELARLT